MSPSLVTEIRRALSALLTDLPGETRVLCGPSEYAQDRHPDKLGFVVRVNLGEPTEKAEEALDTLIAPTGMKALLEADRNLGGLARSIAVTRCSGHQLYDGHLLGAEWSLTALV